MIEAGKKISVLDHGYVMFVEAWGHGLEGLPYDQSEYSPLDTDYEVGIIEGARMSTNKGFLGWGPFHCEKCKGKGYINTSDKCGACKGIGLVLGDEKLLKFLHDKKHSTPFEMAGMTIEVQLPIAAVREWQRHRTQSYSEMSARYEPLPDVNYRPSVERCFMVNATNKQAGAVKGSAELTHESVLEWLGTLDEAYRVCQICYEVGLRLGIPKELARLPVPVGRYTRMRASANLRNWLQFMTLRSTLKGPDAQWEIRQFADVVGQIIAAKFPRTWELFVS